MPVSRITIEENRKQRRKEKFKGYTKKCAARYMAQGLCRACGGAKEDPVIQHCNSCRRLRRSNDLKRLYGITLDEYEEMSALQDHVCWICKGKVTSKCGNLLIDHCHKTGKVRGVLCTLCNAGLGGFRDKSQLLERAIEYLRVFGD